GRGPRRPRRADRHPSHDPRDARRGAPARPAPGAVLAGPRVGRGGTGGRRGGARRRGAPRPRRAVARPGEARRRAGAGRRARDTRAGGGLGGERVTDARGRFAAIAGTGSALPSRVVPNSWFEQRVDTTDEWIVDRTGIRERRFAGEGETTSGLATEAAGRALRAAGMEPGQLDLIVVATVTPD